MWALDIQVLAGDSRQNEQDHFHVRRDQDQDTRYQR